MNTLENTNINTIPCLTWNWMKMNKDSADLSVAFENKKMLCDKLPEGISIICDKSIYADEIKGFESIGSGCGNFPNPKLNAEDNAPVPVLIDDKCDGKVLNPNDHPLNKLIDEISAENGEIIKVSGKIENPVVLTLDNSDKNFVSVQNIIAEKDSKATFIFLYESNAAEISQTQIIRTRIIAEENAKVSVIKVQLCGKNVNQIDDTAFICNDKAEAKFIQIELGAGHVDSGLHTTLSGYKSSFKSAVGYLCQENQYLDMNHMVYHYGAKSECKMKVNGTLKDESTKVYRGVIDFKKGCSGAKGNELEETLILNPKAVNKSLPVILCDEEDVEGTHGASIGRLSNDILFYMQTRGISQEEAEKLMARAKIQAVADLIPNDDIKNKIEEFLNKDSQD